MVYSREKPSLVLYIIQIINIVSAIVVHGCQGLLHALSRDILNGFHFSRDLELMRKQLDCFSTSLYPFLILFIQYVVFSTLVLVVPSGPRVPYYCASLRSRIPPVNLYWFPVASFPVQGILSINAMDLESKYCYFYHSWDLVPYDVLHWLYKQCRDKTLDII